VNPKRTLIEISVLRALCGAVKSPYANSLAKALESPDWTPQNIEDLRPDAYNHWRPFALDYALYSYLRKWEFGADLKSLERKALSTFKSVESAVRATNRRLASRSGTPGVEGIISDARRKIIEILYPRSSSDDSLNFPFEEFATSCGWGKGATYSLKADAARLDNKLLESRLSVTSDALPLAITMLRWDSSWMAARCKAEILGPYSVLPNNFEVVPGGRFTTVPKDTKSRRSIDIQPTANLFLQKGVGKVIRRRLQRCGINLDDQSRNQSLAAIAQETGLCTIDLASASDSISSELVRLLLPPSWVTVLDALRTSKIRLEDDSILHLEKFSAMGNGFTFELESLLFYAICYGVVRQERQDQESPIAVYGDDIIVSTQHSARLIEVLGTFGFQVNVDKTFTTGSFYESCGKHYFNGIDVTPLYQKEEVQCLPSTIRAANRVFRWAVRLGQGKHIDGAAVECWGELRNHALSMHQRLCRLRDARSRRLRGRRLRNLEPLPFPSMPYGYEGDGALIDPGYDPCTDVHGSFCIDEVVARPVKEVADEYALLAVSLQRGIVTESPFNGKTSVRGRTRILWSKRKVSLLDVEIPLFVSPLATA